MKKKKFIRKGKEVVSEFKAQSGVVEKTSLKVKKGDYVRFYDNSYIALNPLNKDIHPAGYEEQKAKFGVVKKILKSNFIDTNKSYYWCKRLSFPLVIKMGNGSVVYATCRNVIKDKPSPFSLSKSMSKNSRKMTGDVHIEDYLNQINNFINK